MKAETAIALMVIASLTLIGFGSWVDLKTKEIEAIKTEREIFREEVRRVTDSIVDCCLLEMLLEAKDTIK